MHEVLTLVFTSNRIDAGDNSSSASLSSENKQFMGSVVFSELTDQKSELFYESTHAPVIEHFIDKAHWSEPFVKLAWNVFGYGSVILPLLLLVKFIERRKSVLLKGSGLFNRLIRVIALGNSEVVSSDPEKSATNGETVQASSRSGVVGRSQYPWLLFCFFGLQVSYLTWGVLQEKIMTRNYEAADGSENRFRNSQFLVLVNRLSAFLLASAYIIFSYARQPPHRAPLYAYGFASFSNIMSAWFQYEALKFITFPTQVLGKACKTIPVMIMGRCVRQKTYPLNEYFTAALISAGVSLFLLATANEKSSKATVSMTTLSGLVLMIGYLVSDSFTSNWQSQLFKVYRMSSMQMMAGVNLFSVLLTFVSELEQGSLLNSFNFAVLHSRFQVDVLVLSFCSAIGQVFIFRTISDFGPVTFTIMMTIRQGLAIFLSCIIFGHHVDITGILGVLIVFVALLLRVFFSQKYKKSRESN